MSPSIIIIIFIIIHMDLQGLVYNKKLKYISMCKRHVKKVHNHTSFALWSRLNSSKVSGWFQMVSKVPFTVRSFLEISEQSNIAWFSSPNSPQVPHRRSSRARPNHVKNAVFKSFNFSDTSRFFHLLMNSSAVHDMSMQGTLSKFP